MERMGESGKKIRVCGGLCLTCLVQRRGSDGSKGARSGGCEKANLRLIQSIFLAHQYIRGRSNK